MSKRPRENLVVDQFGSQPGNKSSVSSSARSGELAAKLATPPLNCDLSRDRFAEDVSCLIAKFKTINSAVTTLQSRRKLCLWETVVESYQAIATDALTLEDLLVTLSIWREAFNLRWHVKSVDAHDNPRGYELVVEIPPRFSGSDGHGSNGAQSPAPSRKAASMQESSSKLLMQRIGVFT